MSSLNSSKSETHDKGKGGGKKIPEWNSCWLGSGFGAMQTQTLDIAAQKYCAVVVATNQTTTMWAAGAGGFLTGFLM